MAIQNITPFALATVPDGKFTPGSFGLNAANEVGAIIGRLWLEGGSGSKTISVAGGGEIWVSVGASVFATASSTLNCGIEDIASTGLADGTQDVFGSRVAGTDTVAANVFHKWLMTSGTKTISHGAKIAVTMRMPVRAGADSVAVGSFSLAPMLTSAAQVSCLPYGQANAAKGPEMLTALIKFDDGTYGWIGGTVLIEQKTATQVIINSGTTPDEEMGSFEVLIPTSISHIMMIIDDFAAADLFEIILYSDPYGATPTIIEAIAIDPDADTNEGATIGIICQPLTTPVTLQVGVEYGISIRPTTANSVSLYYHDLGSGFEDLKKLIPFFTNVKRATRTNNSGPFAESQVYHVPLVGVMIDGFDDGVVPASSTSDYAFVG